jgi:glycosyltransferase involved in cell wall biosynthesis
LFVSTPAWLPLLPSATTGRPVEWLPVPSNVALTTDPVAVAAIRAGVTSEPDGLILGHFGTFGESITVQLEQALPRLLRSDRHRSALLIGRGSNAFAERLLSHEPDLAGRVVASGEVTAEAVAANLRACDLLLQPYPDGATGRRTSLMAGLALGVPAVTTSGSLTEPLWAEENLAALVPANDVTALVAAAEALLTDPDARRRLGERACGGYARHFSLERIVGQLRSAAGYVPTAPDRGVCRTLEATLPTSTQPA